MNSKKLLLWLTYVGIYFMYLILSMLGPQYSLFRIPLKSRLSRYHCLPLGLSFLQPWSNYQAFNTCFIVLKYLITDIFLLYTSQTTCSMYWLFIMWCEVMWCALLHSFLARIPAGSTIASFWNCSMPLTFPYTHFKTTVLPVIKKAEPAKRIARCQVFKMSMIGYGYLHKEIGG